GAGCESPLDHPSRPAELSDVVLGAADDPSARVRQAGRELVAEGVGAHEAITMRTSPAFTAWPGSTRTSATVPAALALNSFSIFIASMTSSVSPTCTRSPGRTAMCVTRPGSGARSEEHTSELQSR